VAIAAPVWLVAVCLPAPVFLAIRLVATVAVLIVSAAVFISQAREHALGAPPIPEDAPDPRRRFIEMWEEFEHEDRGWGPAPAEDIPVVVPVAPGPTAMADGPALAVAEPPRQRRRDVEEAESPSEALWWLTFQQAWILCGILAVVGFLAGMLMPRQGQVLWPIVTLMLGVACGTAAFAPEQRDLSYQFLAAQHLPLRRVWRFKIGFWFATAALVTLFIVMGWFLIVLAQIGLRPAAAVVAPERPELFHLGSLRELMGPVLFFTIWLAYGFSTGQLIVWLCRKTILALLLSGMLSAGAIGLWMPSLLCRGMSGWQLWLPPVAILVAGHWLVRAWAGGRIKERKPALALIGLGAGVVAWVALNIGYRTWEIPDVGEPLDRTAFRDSIPTGNDNLAGRKIQDAMSLLDHKDGRWLAALAEVPGLPLGVIEVPLGDGQLPLLRHLPVCRHMANRLDELALKEPPAAAFNYRIQILALSRNLRNKAALMAYLEGIGTEAKAVAGLDRWLAEGKPSPELLRRALDELNRHVAETPSPLDCLQTECYRAGGLVTSPTVWSFSLDGRGIPERWLTRLIALSLEMPWEEERRLRLWQVVWAGLFRGLETPVWELPTDSADNAVAGSDSTRKIMQGWLPFNRDVSAQQVARLLDASWLHDERLFCPILPLRAATRARWRVDSCRLTAALMLYEIEQRKPADKLEDLVPKYVPAVPVDPYSGQALRYRVSRGEHVEEFGDVRAGQGVVWSTGPDRVDDGGREQGSKLADDHSRWAHGGGLDLIAVVPRRP
jgi:hypothetical protein